MSDKEKLQEDGTLEEGQTQEGSGLQGEASTTTAQEVLDAERESDIANDGAETVDLAEDSEAIDEFFEQADASASSPLAGINQATYDQMTKRNQQFMFNLDSYLVEDLEYEARAKVYQEMVDTLIQGQLFSQTARQIYGTPSEVAKVILEQEISVATEAASEGEPWQVYLDGALFLGSIFTFLTGLSMLNAEEVQGSYMGVLTMIVNYLVAGVTMLMISRVIPNPDAPKGERGYLKYFGVSVLGMMLWFVAITLTSTILPASINPILSGQAYIIIGIATFALRYFLKKRFNIDGVF